MEPWQIGLVLVMALGVGAIVAGALIDRSRDRERARALTAPPDRPGLDPSLRPAYVQAGDAFAGTPPTADDEASDRVVARGESVTAPLADPALVTSGRGRAHLVAPRVLICSDEVATFREVLGVVAAHDPLVLVAPDFAEDVRRTLAVNRSRGLHDVIAVVADDEARAQVVALTGAMELSRRDLRSGWLPAAGLGSATAWVAERSQSWVEPRPDHRAGQDTTPNTGA